jgi:hypothetical protein
MRVTFRNYGQGARFELVGESHTDRVQYYSQARADASRKIQTDEVMDALIERLEDEGFVTHEQRGPAPDSARGGMITMSLEVARGGDVSHWAVGRGSDPREHQAFLVCMNDFVELYNLTQAYQTIENPEGPGFFEEARSKRPSPRP